MYDRLNDLIVNELKECDDYVSAGHLGELFKVNEKTIRRRIKQINQIIPLSTANIESVSGRGYKLIIHDLISFKDYYDYVVADITMNNRLNRRMTIFEKLTKDLYTSKEYLLTTLSISESTLQQDLKELNDFMEIDKVLIAFNYQKGLYLIGHEYNIRNALLRVIFDSGVARMRRRESRNFTVPIKNNILDILNRKNMVINHHTLDALLNYLYMAIWRCSHGFKIDDISAIKDIHIDSSIHQLALLIFSSISNLENISNCFEEVFYFSCFLKSMLPTEFVEIGEKKDIFYLEATKKTESTVKILNKIGLNNNDSSMLKEIHNFFYQFSMRLYFNVIKRSSIVGNIKKSYPVSYLLSSSIFLNLYPQNSIDSISEEIAYFSLIIDSHLIFNNYNNKNILVILPSNEAISINFKHELEKLVNCNIIFLTSAEIKTINVKTMNSLDLIVNPTTYPFTFAHKKVLSVSEVLSTNDIHKIYRFLWVNDSSWLNNKFTNNLDVNLKQELFHKSDHSIIEKDFSIHFARLDDDEPFHIYEANKRLNIVINNAFDRKHIVDILRVVIEIIEFSDDSTSFQENTKKILKLYTY